MTVGRYISEKGYTAESKRLSYNRNKKIVLLFAIYLFIYSFIEPEGLYTS